ncbi:unnamed protein product [Peniophora sp. CBMAI 1063]|nr:unnamed protein product [Peniophora sp. CBMAI 1063]
MSSRVSTTGVPGRFHIDNRLRDGAKGVLGTAIEALSVAATTTQNVPYIATLSSIITEILKIYQEVDVYRSDWKAVADMADQLKSIIDDVHDRCADIADGRDSVLPEGISKPFIALETCLADVLGALNACMPSTTSNAKTVGLAKKMKGLGRDILNRRELSNQVKQCREEMQRTLDLFNTKLQIDQSLTMLKLIVLIENWGKQMPRSMAIPASVSLPNFPGIFHGRALEVNHIIDLLLNKTPARVAILGSGGIGKTSIAQAVLHHHDIVKVYSERRYFLSCEAYTTAESIARGLLSIFQLAADTSDVSPRDLVISHLCALPDSLLCLDNLETPWDSDVQGVESLLGHIASLRGIALIVTSRGGDRPAGVAWTRPFLPQIIPLSIVAALDTWDDICGSHDEYSEKLVQAVDCVPLAVTLLANLAQSESAEALWMRWGHEQTVLLRGRGSENRLNSVEASIRLSLQGPRLAEDPAAADLLSVLCTLPQGMPISRTMAFVNAFSEGLPNLMLSSTSLKQSALAYTSDDGYLRVLSPIRHYMLSHHPPSNSLLSSLVYVYSDLLEGGEFPNRFGSQVQYVRTYIRPELGNISAVLKLWLANDTVASDRMLRAINAFAALCHVISIYDTPEPLLTEAIKRVGTDITPIAARLWYTKGQCLYFQDHESEALSALSTAHMMYSSLGRKRDEAECAQTMGDIHQRLGRGDEAERLLGSALDLYQSLDDCRGQIETLLSMSNVQKWRGQHGDMERTLERALDLAREIEDHLLQAHLTRSLGDLYAQVHIQRYEEAEQRLRSAEALYQDVGDRLGEAHALKALGSLCERLNRLPEAESALKSALEIYQEIKNVSGEANTRVTLGMAYRKTNRLEEACATLLVAHDLGIRISDLVLQGNAMSYLGIAYVSMAELDKAEECFEKALQVYTQGNHTVNSGQAQIYLDIVRREKQSQSS